jgi:hypothetical protein
MRRTFAALIFVVTACGPVNKPPQTAANGSGQGSNLVCHEVTDTGSMFSHTECQTVEDARYQREGAQQFMATPRPTPPPAGGGGGR